MLTEVSRERKMKDARKSLVSRASPRMRCGEAMMPRSRAETKEQGYPSEK